MIFAVKPFEIHDGDGVRTTVFFKGCPLRCRWCHNPEAFTEAPQLSFSPDLCRACGLCAAVCPTGAQSLRNGVHTFERADCKACGVCVKVCEARALRLYGENAESPASLADRLARDKRFFDASGGGVTLSGGEPLMQADFCAELLKNLKALSINTAVDTCGFVKREVFDRVIPYTDTFLYDVKAFDEDVHLRCTGVPNGLILDNLRYLDSRGCRIEVRIPYVPGYNDDQLPKIGRFLAGLSRIVRVRVLPYHSFAEDKYRSLGMTFPTASVRVPDRAEIDEAVRLLRDMGCPASSPDAL